MNIEIEIVTGMGKIDPRQWDALTEDSPLLSHAFLCALEDTHCVGPGTGWQPYPLIVRQEGRIVGAMPLYIKSHSYGEYVFDWAWSDAYQRNGLAYYPKLLSAIPFTPVSGARLFAHDPEIQSLMLQVLLQRGHSGVVVTTLPGARGLWRGRRCRYASKNDQHHSSYRCRFTQGLDGNVHGL